MPSFIFFLKISLAKREHWLSIRKQQSIGTYGGMQNFPPFHKEKLNNYYYNYTLLSVIFC